MITRSTRTIKATTTLVPQFKLTAFWVSVLFDISHEYSAIAKTYSKPPNQFQQNDKAPTSLYFEYLWIIW